MDDLTIRDIFSRCVCPALTDRKKRISKSYRTCRSNTNQSNCCAIGNDDTTNSPFVGDAIGDEQRHFGRRGSDELCAGPGSNVHSRARPLYIPSDERTRYHHESNYEPQGPLQPGPLVQIQQPRRQPERPTELFLPTKQLENGYANSKSQNSSYMEQFWICTKRFDLEACFFFSARKLIKSFFHRRKSSFGFRAAGEARENLLHETSKPKQ